MEVVSDKDEEKDGEENSISSENGEEQKTGTNAASAVKAQPSPESGRHYPPGTATTTTPGANTNGSRVGANAASTTTAGAAPVMTAARAMMTPSHYTPAPGGPMVISAGPLSTARVKEELPTV